MNSFETLIKGRRSTRTYNNGEPLSPEQVELILKAGLMSPSSKRSTPWQFIVVEEKEMLEKLAAAKKTGSQFLGGCALAVVVMANVMESEAWIEDASIASILMQLQAEDLGLGSCWCQIRGRQREDESDAADYIRRLLNAPYQLEVLSVIGFGHKAQENKPFDESRLQWERVHIGKYQMPEGEKSGSV
ncbi:MAG: nitroreductase family protein [Tannerellaceae bacterium]|jgi:nitroreductase|nr:nitroreductase family protein [Tannerellaceae bacterium]